MQLRVGQQKSLRRRIVRKHILELAKILVGDAPIQQFINQRDN